MTNLSLVPVFMIGLLGGVHCVGMCGGIVAALSVTSGTKRPFPIAVATEAAALDGTLRVLAYNFGRIGSYAAAGAVAGGVAGAAGTFSSLASLQIGGYWLANLMLVALGLYLMDVWRGLTTLEAAGQFVWRRVQPLIKHLVPMDSWPKALALGGLWGWLPCGMVYSVLVTAMFTGSAASGATVMMVFGLGTLPTLLGLGLLGARLKTWTQRRPVRVAGGLIVLAFGVLGLVRATNGLSLGWLDTLCLNPPAASGHR